METNLKTQLAELEAEVSAIKDPALRSIAFERLLDRLVPASNAQHKSEPPRKSAASRAKGLSPHRPSTKAKGKNKVAEFYATAQVREEVQKLAVSGAVNGLPALRECRREWQKFLWILSIAKRAGVEGLNNHEIAFLLTKRFYRATKYTAVNHIRLKVEVGFVTPDPETQRWLITPEGEEHLKSLMKDTEHGENG